jgi:hypothetical protein
MYNDPDLHDYLLALQQLCIMNTKHLYKLDLLYILMRSGYVIICGCTKTERHSPE